MSSGLIVLAAAVVVTIAVATARADGRFRDRRRRMGVGEDDAPAATGDPRATQLAAHLFYEGFRLGDRATLLQLSSAFCAPCRATRVILADVADLVPGVAHVEIDAESNHTLVRMLGILRTPTTLILDSAGREVRRASGVPSRDEVLTTLSRVISR